MIREWYAFFANPGNCLAPTLGLFFLIFLTWLTYVWDASNTGFRKPTNGDLAQIYFSGAMCFFIGGSVFGLLIAPDNTDALFGLLGVKPTLLTTSTYVQSVILWFLTKIS